MTYLLSARQRALLDKLSTGASNKEIAADMGISISMVKLHSRNARDLLGAKNTAHACALFSASAKRPA